VGGGFAGSINNSKFEMSLYAEEHGTPMIQAGTLSHFTAHFTEPVSKETTLLVRKNGASTAAKCVMKNGEKACADNTDTVVFAASDLIVVEGTYSGSNNGTNPSWSATYP
jgi:hypothetical protein